MKVKNRRGITLIALIVTIIVLLLLAGITLQFIFVDGGIIEKARESKVRQEVAIIMDQLVVAEANASVNHMGKIDLDKYTEQIKKERIFRGR